VLVLPLEPLYLGDGRWARFKCAAASLYTFFVEGPRRMSLARRLGFYKIGVEYAVLAVFEGEEV
jgi:hypothetical protein